MSTETSKEKCECDCYQRGREEVLNELRNVVKGDDDAIDTLEEIISGLKDKR